MLKLLIAACGLALFVSTPACAAPTTQAVARSEAIMADIDHLTVELKYHGNEDKPHYRLTLSVPRVAERNDQTFAPALQISTDDARSLFDHLVAEGFLDSAFAVQEVKNKIPEPAGPTYTLTLRTSSLIFIEDIGWSEPMVARLEKLKPVLPAEAAPAMDRLLSRLEGYRGKWDKPKLENLDGMKVLKIAKGEIDKLNWPLGASYTLQSKDGVWSATAWRVAEYTKEGKALYQTGGYRDLQIDKTGRIVRNLVGY